MPTAIITQPDVTVRLSSERLQVWAWNEDSEKEECIREIPLFDLERIVITERVHLTSPALAELLRRSIPIEVFGFNDQYLGGFLPAAPAYGRTRLLQYSRCSDKEFTLAIARKIVAAKLYNQRRILQRLVASRLGELDENVDGDGEESAPPDTPVGEKERLQEVKNAIEWLGSFFERIRNSQDLDELRGYEGIVTASYFRAWEVFLPPEFPFEYRSTRPPHNPVNACISFGATVLYSEAIAACHAHGLDPAIGTLHTTEDNRWSLALDLIEPFRPVLVEALALDLFSHRMLNMSHFEFRDGGCFLNLEGRKKFFLQYERRMERQFLSETLGIRTTLWTQLEKQAEMFKAALTNPDKFEPFIMN